MDPALDRLEPPTAELLLDVRTPSEPAFSPDGARVAFALHATVADVGSFLPSDRYVAETEGDMKPVQLTSGAWSDRTPAWSPDGSLLALLSDRITPGHQLPYTMPATGGGPQLAATLVGSARTSSGRATAAGYWCWPRIPARTDSTGPLVP